MLKKIFPFALLTLVVACDSPVGKVGADGYRFGKPSFERSQIDMRVVTYKTRREFMIAAKKHGVKSDTVVAFSELKPPEFNVCIVHIMDPRVDYQPEFMGHELAHCLYGQWHTNNDSRE